MFKFFKKRQQVEEPRFYWRVPGGEIRGLSDKVLDGGAHTMIAGNTRSGKSTLLHGIMADALKEYAPSEVGFYFIDIKRVELLRYKNLPHTLGYANNTDDAVNMLWNVVAEMEARYELLERAEVSSDTPKYRGKKIYVVIDELVQMMTGSRKRDLIEVLTVLLSQAGAANIWFIVGTQAPRRDVLPGRLMLYFTLVIGLSMATAVESRCALGVKGCESLPLHGKALVRYGPEVCEATIPPVDLRKVAELIAYWQSPDAKVPA